VAEGLEVISARLLTAQMSINTHVSSGTREGFALAVWNVLLGLRVAILLRHAKIDDVDDVGCLGTRAANEEIVGLDVTVDEVLLVYGLDPRQHLLGNHDNGLYGKPTAAVVKEIFERRAQEINDQDVMKALLTEVVDIWNASWNEKVSS
jgi:hypothetical protein